jgi:hypothetical protein
MGCAEDVTSGVSLCGILIVPQKIYRPDLIGVRVKRRGKSPRQRVAIHLRVNLMG